MLVIQARLVYGVGSRGEKSPWQRRSVNGGDKKSRSSERGSEREGARRFRGEESLVLRVTMRIRIQGQRRKVTRAHHRSNPPA